MSNVTDNLTTSEQNPSGQDTLARKDVDARMARIRQALNLDSDSKLAKVLGLSQKAVSSARTRQQLPSSWIVQIADRFGISADWILFGEGPMKRGEESRKDMETGRELQPGPLRPVRPELLTATIEGVELYMNKHKKYMDPEKKAQLILLLYEEFLEKGTIELDLVTRHLRIVA